MLHPQKNESYWSCLVLWCVKLIWNDPCMTQCGDGEVVFPDGKPKGMRRVLEERGIDVSRMKADDMRQKLKEMSDFKYEKTKVKTYITSKGHRCMFIPKYHCELNPIEREWGHCEKVHQKSLRLQSCRTWTHSWASTWNCVHRPYP